jgi:transcriptional regulator with XRE-family HTH domain
MMDIATVIKKARLQKGFTQEELAKKVGVKKSAVAKWENGRVSEIKRSNLKMLAEALGLKPTDLLGDIKTENDAISTANELADIYLDVELRKMIAEYKSLNDQKQAQVREYVHLLSKKD